MHVHVDICTHKANAAKAEAIIRDRPGTSPTPDTILACSALLAIYTKPESPSKVISDH